MNNAISAAPREGESFAEALGRRVLVLDGSMGVMLQRLGLDESAVRGRRFMTHSRQLLSNLDILCLSRPELVAGVHRAYLEAGADIIETNTFNANAISQREFATVDLVEEINRAGARIATQEVRRIMAADPSRPRFVAGSMGPTPLSASLPVDVDDPAARAVDFDTLSDAYMVQAKGLTEGGADLLLVETAYDAINVKAALHGIHRAFRRLGRELPVVVSMTVSDASGRILSGQTPEALLAAVAPFGPAAVGFNCGAGPDMLAPWLSSLARTSPLPTVFYPNAGLPDRMGRYSVGPEEFVADIRPLLKSGALNIVGGCCGTTPEHIALLASTVREDGFSPRRVPDGASSPWLSGLDPFTPGGIMVNVGERCNVAGSRNFLKMISGGDSDGALAVACRQVADGAMMLDINMDDGLLDAPREMERFLRLLGSDPKTASVPWMIDSSDFAVIECGLKNIGGRPVVNSISLKHGEEEFLRQASVVRDLGAAVVVMLFDERGQADTFERKIGIAARAVGLLTEKCGFSPRDIIIDPNVLTVATGMPEHDRYALDFIRAVEWIHANLPGVLTSGGVSNLSFAFRGNNYLRQAMHAVFLFHATRAGLSMGIVDPGTRVAYADIPAPLLEAIEDVVLCRRADAASRLAAMASVYAGRKVAEAAGEIAAAEKLDADGRLIRALRTGDESTLAADLEESVELHGDARTVVSDVLMRGMEEVGTLFETGRMFLPQVVKSARTMHRAVGILTPLLEKGIDGTARRGRVVLATVKGDVHDIGKNIVAVVLRCNGYEVIDLGVQVEASDIVEAVRRHDPVFVGLSGLISPSLREMAVVASALRDAGITVPLIVGGAATSDLHTAMVIAPAYGDGLVVRAADASRDAVIATRLQADPEGEAAAIRAAQHRLVEEKERSNQEQREAKAERSRIVDGETQSLSEAIDWAIEPLIAPRVSGVQTLPEVPIGEIRPYINYTYFWHCWRVKPDSEEARQLRADAEAMLDDLARQGATMLCQVAFWPAYGHDGVITADGVDIDTRRADGGRPLSSWVAPEGRGDHVGCFLVTTGSVIRQALVHAGGREEADRDDYRLLLLQSLADRLAEATSEWLHRRVRTDLWGYAPGEPEDMGAIRRGEYRGIRPAVGYPSLPDQMQMHSLMRLLRPADLGVEVTENGALSPASSVAGLYLASPRARY